MKESKSKRCGKTRWENERDAEDAINEIIQKKEGGKIPLRSYRCHECHGFHLTSIEQKRSVKFSRKEKQKTTYEYKPSKKQAKKNKYAFTNPNRQYLK